MSQKLDELMGLCARLLGKGKRASAARTGLHKKMKQLVLENDRRKKGVGDSEVQKEIYAFGKGLVGSKIVNELYAAYVASIGAEGNLPWDELLPSGNERGGGAAQAEEEQTAAEEHGS